MSSYYLFDRTISDLVKPDSPSSVVHLPQPGDTIEIYPNPAGNIVSIVAGNASIQQIKVLNVLGVEVLPIRESHESEITLDISRLPSGTYFLQIGTSNGTVLRKIVKEE
jgi:hypothetical protein